MHAEFYDELPEKQVKYGFKRTDLYEELMTIKNIGRKYTKLSMLYPGEYKSRGTMSSSIRGAVNRYEEFKEVFEVRMINGDTWLIRTDM